MSSTAKAALGIILLGCLVVPPALAQKGTEVTIGVMAGANYSKVSQDPASTDITFDYHTGLVAGGFVGIKVNDVFSVEPQALYSVKGTKANGTGSNSSITGSVKLNYLEIPLLGKFWIPISNSEVKPFLFAGPEFEYLISCSVEGTAFSATNSTDCNTAQIKIKSTEFGATVGAGVEFMAGGQSVRVDGRYTHGLTNISDNASDKSTIKNRSFMATVGVGFPLPR
jgi:outer membrane protein W